MKRAVPVVVAAACGCAWAWIASVLLDRQIAWPVWGGIIVSPLIGTLMGLLSIRFHRRTLTRQALLALSSLYAAAALFALAVGAADAAFGHEPWTASHRTPSAVLLESVFGVLAGLTLSGYLLLLWPLAWATHRLVAESWRAAQPES